MTRLRSLIKEVLTVKPKEDCGCGCNDCDGKAPILTEGKVKHLISEGLQYHIDKKIQLHESVYRIGSEKHFELIREARALWVRGLIDVSEDDQAILETHLGHFGMYEGEEVPLDMPMVHEEEQLDEKKKAKKKKKDPPIGKPKRGGSKAYYVYVRDPKTKRIKKVSFGSGGLKAKIRNADARKRFAARHNCKNKKDRTTAGYWSCNLPRYAEQLGLGSKMNTFW